MDRTLVHRHATGNEVPPPLYRGCTGLRVRRLASAASRSHFARFAVHGTFAGHGSFGQPGRNAFQGTRPGAHFGNRSAMPGNGGPQGFRGGSLQGGAARSFAAPQGRLFQAAPSFNRGFTGGGMTRGFGGGSRSFGGGFGGHAGFGGGHHR